MDDNNQEIEFKLGMIILGFLGIFLSILFIYNIFSGDENSYLGDISQNIKVKKEVKEEVKKEINDNKSNDNSNEGDDLTRKEDINKVFTALKIYYNNEGELPNSSELVDLQNIKKRLNAHKNYMNIIPKDPVSGKLYYYMSLKSSGTRNGSAIMVAEMDKPELCNFPGKNIEELQNTINENNSEMRDLIKLKNQGNNLTNPCFYVVFFN